MRDYWKTAVGLLEVELTSADIEQALLFIAQEDIPIFRIHRENELTSTFLIYPKNYKTLAAICGKKGYQLKILEEKGLLFAWNRLHTRPVIIFGLMICLLLIFCFPKRVYFVRVTGNQAVPKKLIMEEAEKCGIRFGSMRRAVRSEQVKNALLGAIPELQWAGVNTYGCTAVISVQERAANTEYLKDSGSVCSIVASRDGIITSCTATGGNLVCKQGDAVTSGQILISGYTDCGFCIQATRASGEVIADTIRDLSSVMPIRYFAPQAKSHAVSQISLSIGKKRINLWRNSGIQSAGCDRISKEYVLTLPGGYALPAVAAVETVSICSCIPAEDSDNDAKVFLIDASSEYVTSQMIAGSIIHRTASCQRTNDTMEFFGRYRCSEMIGTILPEQIGDYHGENG